MRTTVDIPGRTTRAKEGCRRAGLLALLVGLLAPPGALAADMRLITAQAPTWAGRMAVADSGTRVLIDGFTDSAERVTTIADSGVWSIRVSDGESIRVSPQARDAGSDVGRAFQAGGGVQSPDGSWVVWGQRENIALNPSPRQQVFMRRVDPLGPVVPVKRPSGSRYRGELQATAVADNGSILAILGSAHGPVVLEAEPGRPTLTPVRDPLRNPASRSHGEWQQSPDGRVVAICRPEVVGAPKPTPGLTVYDASSGTTRVKAIRGVRTGTYDAGCVVSDSGIAVLASSHRGKGFALVAGPTGTRRLATGRYVRVSSVSPDGQRAVLVDRRGHRMAIVNLRSGRITPVSVPRDDLRPDRHLWRPDSAEILAWTARGHREADRLLTINAADGRLTPAAMEPDGVDFNYVSCFNADGRLAYLGYRDRHANGVSSYARSLIVSDPQRSAFTDMTGAFRRDAAGDLYEIACGANQTFLMSAGHLWVTGPLDGTPLQPVS